MKFYKVRTGCEIAGVWADEGAIVALSDIQARELAPPYGNTVALCGEPQEEDGKDAELDRNKRGHRKAAD